MDAKAWVLLLVGAVVGACVALVSGAVRDRAFDATDAVACWWWGLVDTVRRFFAWLGALALAGLAVWGAVALLLLPRLAEK